MQNLLEKLETAAEQGDAAAQASLGLRYAYGFGVVRDEAEAAKWLRKAAEQGRKDAQFELGLAYAEGRGVTKNTAEATKWLAKAVSGQYNITRRLKFGELLEAARCALWQGDEEAGRVLSEIYANGWGVERNEAKAEYWNSEAEAARRLKSLRQSAEQGNKRAQRALGEIYAEGRSVQKDEVEAAKWYKLAAGQEGIALEIRAEEGDFEAQKVLARQYLKGDGVVRNAEKAAKWCKKAAEQGDEAAQYHLGLMYATGFGLTRDHAEAAKWLEKMADTEKAEPYCCFVQFILGLIYTALKDELKAKQWMGKAARQGLADAQSLFSEIFGVSWEETGETKRKWVAEENLEEADLLEADISWWWTYVSGRCCWQDVDTREVSKQLIEAGDLDAEFFRMFCKIPL
ncbi:MAG: sel1 repeat family protein [Cystobacterineae bacterium]|nr:sel1 repeat family protein [Cystobacterineae bacterium]